MAKKAGIKGTEEIDDDETETEAEAKAKTKADADKPATVETVSDTPEKPSQLQPYPTGNPPDPEDEFEKMHGFRRDGKKKE